MPFGMSVTMKADKFSLNTLFIHWGMQIKAYNAKDISDNDKQLKSSTFIRTVKVHYFGRFIHILNRCEQTHQLNAWVGLARENS